MERKYKVAAVQMDSGSNKMENLAAADRFLEEAARGGARLVCLPENMNLVGKNTGEGGDGEDIPGITSDFLTERAKKHGMYILGGSFRKRIEGDTRCYNASLFVNSKGEILAEYHKIHTFDVTLLDGTATKESEEICPGEEIVAADTHLGRLGFAICYDIRFPEIFRRMSYMGVQVIMLPSNFTYATGRAHWEVLLRTRAIENGCYVIAADQCGRKPAFEAYGHSMVIDPWGRVLADAGEAPGVVFADVDLDYLDEVRERMPLFANRRTDLYGDADNLLH